MRTWVICLLIACAGICGPPGVAAADDAPPRLRVLSYNIHHGQGEDGKLDLERIARVIKSVTPDVVSLQEVDQNASRSGGIDQPAKLAELTGMAADFGSNLALQGGGYGNAVLSRLPIKRHENHKLPCLDGGEQRGVLEAELEVSGGRGSIFFLATHFDHRAAETERLASAKLINAWAAKHEGQRLLLVGDLNALPESKTLDALGAVWKSATAQPRPTFPVDKPTQQIDHILYAPRSGWRVVEVKVLDEAVASDHRPLLAVLEWQPSP